MIHWTDNSLPSWLSGTESERMRVYRLMWVCLIWKNLKSLGLGHQPIPWNITILTPQLPSLGCFVPRKFHCPEPNDSFKQNTPPWSKHSPIPLAKIFCYMLTYTLISKHFPSSEVLFSTSLGVDLWKVIDSLWSHHFAVGLQNQNAGWQGPKMCLYSCLG